MGEEGAPLHWLPKVHAHVHTHGKVASMNLQLQLAKVEKLSLSAPTKFVMSRLLASAFVKRARERGRRERESGSEEG